MKKDIKPPKVEDIGVAIVREFNELNLAVWNVYLINFKPIEIEGVLVSSRGYGEINGEKIKTTQLRHFLDNIKPNSFKKIEPIIENIFGLSNEYWVSFFAEGIMYDKKFIFVAGSIAEENLINIPLIKHKGILIK